MRWISFVAVAVALLLAVPGTAAPADAGATTAAAAPEGGGGAWSGRRGRDGLATLPFTLHRPEGAAAGGGAPVPVAVYLRNLPAPRDGTDADDAIVADLRRDGLLVVDLDCRAVPAESPAREELLQAFHADLPETLASAGADFDRVFYLPPGYRLARDLPYWNLARHGKRGSLERVMATYNGHVVERFGVAPVTRPDDMRGPGGKAIDYDLCLDVIYPSRPARPVPLVVNFATQGVRMRSFAPKGADRAVYPIGFVTSGYAWANVDHCWNPLARPENFGYWAQYTLEDWTGLASATAAIRFLRARAADYGFNDRIGVMGISKASYSAIRLADPDHATGREHFRFKDFPDESPEPQPWPGHASRVDVAYAAAGNGTRRARQYLTRDTVPFATSAGRRDEYKQWDVFPVVVERCEALGLNHLALWMEELGHTYPSGTDLATGEKRYVLLKRFFDQHLRPREEGEAFAVLSVTPPAAATGVGLDGASRTLAPDDQLPKEMLGLSPFEPITVRFARPVRTDSVAGRLSVRDTVTGRGVPGVWTPSCDNTRFRFAPASKLAPQSEYEIVVRRGVADAAGGTLVEEVKRRFTTGG